MPVHDWTQVEAGIFHAFHNAWTATIQSVLNSGVLPEGYYALAEQHAGQLIADVLTLHGDHESAADLRPPSSTSTGGTVVAEAPPRVRRHQSVQGTLLSRRRSIAIRHVSGHRLVALLEIISPGNKDRAQTVDVFVAKVVDALDAGVNVLVVDLFRPTPCDPHGIHEVIHQRLAGCDDQYDLPADEPLTLASYASGPRVEIYLEHVAVGGSLPEMPLFLRFDRYVNVPLESTYHEAYRGMPAFWRDVLEGRLPRS